MRKKNLVMGCATGYDWYKLEPFINSFQANSKDADLVLFVDNISEFTYNRLNGGGTKLLPIPAELRQVHIVNSRWALYDKFLDARGDNYNQVLLTDLRDVIFQGDVFEKYSRLQNFLGYETEGMTIKNSFEHCTYDWLTNLFGVGEAEKLGGKKIICAGTVLATVDAMKILLQKMIEMVGTSTRLGDDQGTFNYLVYENKLDIENIIEIDCHSGNIFTTAVFHWTHPVEVADDKILREDGGVPELVHQYDRQPVLVQLVDKVYRDKNFQPDEKFNDTRSMLEQINHLAMLGRIDEAYKLFTKHLHGRNFVGYVGTLLELLENVLKKNFTPTSELLLLSIQGALASTAGNGFQVEHVSKMAGFMNFCLKNRIAVSFAFRLFAGNILSVLAKQLCDAKQFEQCFSCLEFIESLEINLDQNYYLFKARVCREAGKKAEALSSYEKALNI